MCTRKTENRFIWKLLLYSTQWNHISINTCAMDRLYIPSNVVVMIAKHIYNIEHISNTAELHYWLAVYVEALKDQRISSHALDVWFIGEWWVDIDMINHVSKFPLNVRINTSVFATTLTWGKGRSWLCRPCRESWRLRSCFPGTGYTVDHHTDKLKILNSISFNFLGIEDTCWMTCQSRMFYIAGWVDKLEMCFRCSKWARSFPCDQGNRE